MVSVVIVYNHADLETNIVNIIVNEAMDGSQPIEVYMANDVYGNQVDRMD